MPAPIIFDLDGTLVESLLGITEAINRALAAHDFPTHPAEDVRRFIGSGALVLVQRAMPKSAKISVEELEVEFRTHYNDTWQQGTELFPEIADFLANLKKNGHPLAILSNKPHKYTVDIANYLFADGTFDHVLGKSDKFPAKPDPASALFICEQWQCKPEQAIFVGDSIADAGTAANAGMKFLGVSWGYHSEGPDFPMVKSVSELRNEIHEFQQAKL